MILVSACSISGGPNKSKKVVGIADREISSPFLPKRIKIDRNAYNFFASGSIFESLGDYDNASRLYLRALKLVPTSDYLRYSLANSLYMLKNYDETIYHTSQISNKDLNTWLLMGNAYRSKAIYDSALFAFTEAVKLDSTIVSAYYFIGAFYQQSENLDSAIWAYKHVARLTTNYQSYFQLANIQLKAGYQDDARKNFHEAINLDSSSSNIRSFLGLSAIYESRGERDKSIGYLESASEMAPNDVAILNHLLGFYQEAREMEKARDIALRLVPLAPNDKSISRRLGVIYYYLDSLQSADSIFTNLIDNGDKNVINHYYLGQTAFRLENMEQAIKHFAHLTQVEDSLIDGWLNLAMVYYSQESYDKEIATYNEGLKHIKNTNDSIIIMFNLGSRLERLKQIDRAITVFEKILEIKPDHEQSLNYLGYTLADNDMKLDYAYDLILRALEISPENGAYIDSHGWVLYKLGKYNKALGELLKAFEFIDNDPIITDHIGDVYKAISETDKAREYWQKALELDPDNEKIKEKLAQ
jgi:tetratricopeptide (TPR) repeat protein